MLPKKWLTESSVGLNCSLYLTVVAKFNKMRALEHYTVVHKTYSFKVLVNFEAIVCFSSTTSTSFGSAIFINCVNRRLSGSAASVNPSDTILGIPVSNSFLTLAILSLSCLTSCSTYVIHFIIRIKDVFFPSTFKTVSVHT